MEQVTYRLDKEIAIQAWLNLYRTSDWNLDWTVRNAEVMLGHAYLIITAWLGGKMVGTLTVLSDGLNYATIDDVVVHPEHRGQGVGSHLMQLAVEQVGHLEPHLEAIPGVAPFYEMVGFVANQGHTGMYWPSSQQPAEVHDPRVTPKTCSSGLRRASGGRPPEPGLDGQASCH